MRLKRVGVVLAAVTMLASAVTACAPSGRAGHDPDVVNYALPANFTPDWILPVGDASHLNTNNLAISAALWENLIAYDGSTGRIAWNKQASVATDVTFSADATSARITLGDRHWSDGRPVTARDVEFWFNLVKANKDVWAGYNDGQIPDNIKQFQIDDARHITLVFDRAYNTQWMLANELSQITPMPQHVWDRTAAGGAVGDADRTTAGAKGVWSYLTDAASHVDSYATDALWKVVDGPYRIGAFSTTGHVTLTKESRYDGGQRANIPTVKLVPFASADAEVNAIRSGSIDYGYINPTDLSERDTFANRGYRIEPWTGWAITYLPYNFANPQLGAVFSQLYARQAIQMSVDQTAMSKVLFEGTATPGYGPIPQAQSSDYVSSVQASNPYPFDPSKAKSLLQEHGWQIGSDGVLRCRRPGTGSDQCGSGVKDGTRFAMTVLSQSGSVVTQNMMTVLQSSLSLSGIKLTVKTAPVASVLAQTPACKADQAICDWQLSFFGTAGSWYFTAYPTGESLFQTDGGANFGSYSDKTVDRLITATTTSKDSAAITDYSAAVAKALPVVWLPSPDYQISAIKNGLTGFKQDSLAVFHPAQWRWSDG